MNYKSGDILSRNIINRGTIFGVVVTHIEKDYYYVEWYSNPLKWMPKVFLTYGNYEVVDSVCLLDILYK